MLSNISQENSTKDYGKVAVFLGGISAERDISLRSGEAIYKALLAQNVDAVKMDTRDPIAEQLKDNSVDRVFICLHGRDGEDGVVQGFLQTLQIPFTGSDMASSALAMNKKHCKQVWVQMGLPTAPFYSFDQDRPVLDKEIDQALKHLGNELFVKPNREGSSVGMTRVSDKDSLIEGVKLAHQFDDALVEQFVAGDEYTVAILNGKALPSIRLSTPREFYDYKAKYEESTTEYFCPSGLTEEEEESLQLLALKAFHGIGCSGWGRVDFIRDRSTQQFMLLEVNTVPGMTATSLVPKAANAVGLGFEQLVQQILNTSLKTAKRTHGVSRSNEQNGGANG